MKKIRKSRLSDRLSFFISAFILLSAIGCYFLIPSFNEWVKEAYEILTSDDEQRIENWVSNYGIWGPVVIIVLMVVQMFLFVIPNVLLMMIAILSYGPFWGALLALFGVFAASSVGYRIGFKLGPYTLQRFVSMRLQEKFRAFINEYGFTAIAITRLSSFSNDALSFVAGLLKMGYVKFISATLLGITPLIIILALFGRDGKIEKGLIWIAAVSLVLLVVYIIIDKRKKKKANASP